MNGSKEVVVDLASELEQRLPAESLNLIRAAGELANEQGMGLYLVGGAVRDLLLERPNFDLDLVVEGDAIKLAKLLAEREGGEVLIYRRFGTAKVSRGKLTIDFATARTETYAYPGALPKVRPGSIEDDLHRRDFTINAMAIQLNPDNFGKLLDPCGGRGDLEKGLIRVLHLGSFIDDATRMFRAVRYEQRYGFKIEPETKNLIYHNLAMVNTLSGDRIRHELEKLFVDENPCKMLRRASELEILREVHYSIRGSGWLEEKLTQARTMVPDPPAALYYSIMLFHLNQKEGEELITRLKLAKRPARVVMDTLSLKEKLPLLITPELSNSAIYRELEGYHLHAILAAYVATESEMLEKRLRLYLSNLRFVTTLLDAKALLKMGVPSGPELGEVLWLLKEAKLDERLSNSKAEEVELVNRWLAEHQGG